MKKRYLSIDPGPTTGICVVDENDLTDPRFNIRTWNLKLDGKLPHRDLYTELCLYPPALIICERFQFRPDQKGADIKAGEYVGVVQLYAQLHNTPIVMQNSSLVGQSAFWSDDNKRVKLLALYKPKAAPHGMDALRHFLYYYTFTLKGRYFLERLPKDAIE